MSRPRQPAFRPRTAYSRMEQFRNWAWRPQRAALQIEEENQMRNQRSGIAAPRRTFNKYPTAPNTDGRGASTVTRRQPHGKDPLAAETGKPNAQPGHDKEHT